MLQLTKGCQLVEQNSSTKQTKYIRLNSQLLGGLLTLLVQVTQWFLQMYWLSKIVSNFLTYDVFEVKFSRRKSLAVGYIGRDDYEICI